MIYISAIFFPLFAAFMGNQIFPTDFMTIVSVIIAAELVILYAMLAPGGISHSGPGENRQFWPDENSQS